MTAREGSHLNRVLAGVDIGGTNVKVGLVDRSGTFQKFESFPTPRDHSGNLDLSALTGKVGRVIRHAPFKAERIGVGVPGLLNENRDTVMLALNLGLRDVRLAALLEQSWGLPVVMDSDVVMGAIGEKRFGAATSLDRFLYISIGTGISACLFDRAAIFRNMLGGPLDIGHMSIDPGGTRCSCGNRGCLERYVSGRGIVEQAQRRWSRDRTAWGLSGEALTVETVARLADRGHHDCREILRHAGFSLGHAIVNLIHIFGWYPVIIGGGLSRLERYFIRHAHHVVQRKLDDRLSGLVVMRAAAHPSRAGVLGAACSSSA